MCTGGDKLYFLLGQTASGKGKVSLPLADLIGAEILVLDSMKVYRGMDIGTAKPEKGGRAPVHLIDVVTPGEHFSVAAYLDLAERAVADVRSRGNRPLFVGGTALYAKALTSGLFDGPPADAPLRRRLLEIEEAEGPGALHRKLCGVDPAAAGRIHINDLRRIVRALEIREKTGRAISALQAEETAPRHTGIMVCLRRQREDLRNRIVARIRRMIAQGFVEEVKRLRESGGPGMQSSQAIGYNEIGRCLDGEFGIEEAVRLIEKRTWQMARRQMTWFKGFPGVQWLDVAPDEPPEETASRAAAFFKAA